MATKNHTVKGNDHLPALATDAGYQDWRSLWVHNSALSKKRKNPLILFHGNKKVPAGDTVVIPETKKKKETGSTNTHHPLKTSTDKVFLRLRVLDEEYQPVKNATYLLTIKGKKYPTEGEGQFEDNGMINVQVPKTAKTGRLVVKYKPPKAQDDALKSPGVIEGTRTEPESQSKSTTSSSSSTQSTSTTQEAQKEPDPVEIIFDLDIGRLDPIQEKAPDDDCFSGVQQRLNNLAFDAGTVDGYDGPNTQSAIKRFQRKYQIDVTGKPDAKTQKALYDYHDQPGKVPKPPPPPKPTTPHPPKPSGTGGGTAQPKPSPPPRPTTPHPSKPSGTGGGTAQPKPKPPPKPTTPHPPKPSTGG